MRLFPKKASNIVEYQIQVIAKSLGIRCECHFTVATKELSLLDIDLTSSSVADVKTFLGLVYPIAISTSNINVNFRCDDSVFEYRDTRGFLVTPEQVAKYLLRQPIIVLEPGCDIVATLDREMPQVQPREEGVFDVIMPKVLVTIQGSQRNLVPFGKVTGHVVVDTDRNTVKGLPSQVVGYINIHLHDDAELRYFVQNWSVAASNYCYATYHSESTAVPVPKSSLTFAAPFALRPFEFFVGTPYELELPAPVVDEFLYRRIGITRRRYSHNDPQPAATPIEQMINRHQAGALWSRTAISYHQLLFKPLETVAVPQQEWFNRYVSSDEPDSYVLEGVVLNKDRVTRIPEGVFPAHAKRIVIDSCWDLTDISALPAAIGYLDLVSCTNLQFHRFAAKVDCLQLSTDNDHQRWDVFLTAEQAACANIVYTAGNIVLHFAGIDALYAFVLSGTTIEPDWSISRSAYEDDDIVYEPSVKMYKDYLATNDYIALVSAAETYYHCTWPQQARAAPVPDVNFGDLDFEIPF